MNRQHPHICSELELEDLVKSIEPEGNGFAPAGWLKSAVITALDAMQERDELRQTLKSMKSEDACACCVENYCECLPEKFHAELDRE